MLKRIGCKKKLSPKGWTYILECGDGSFYTGSTINLNIRISEHQNGKGANHTKNRLPVKLVYSEKFHRIQEAFKREKQIQNWCRAKKIALINGNNKELKKLAIPYRDKYKIINDVG